MRQIIRKTISMATVVMMVITMIMPAYSVEMDIYQEETQEKIVMDTQDDMADNIEEVSADGDVSGSCGTNANWSYNANSGTLTITGIGTITSTPWSAYKNYIRTVKMLEGISVIPARAFNGYSNLTTLHISRYVTQIQENALTGLSSNFKVIYYGDIYNFDNIQIHPTNLVGNGGSLDKSKVESDTGGVEMSLSFEYSKVTMNTGQTYELTVTSSYNLLESSLFPGVQTIPASRHLVWTSSNPDIISVNVSNNTSASQGEQYTDSATIRADYAGTSKITVKDPVTEATAEITIESSDISVTGISLSQSSLVLNAGYAAELTSFIEPSNATNKKVTWRSTNTEIAIVDRTGTVTALSQGTCNITATTDDGGYEARCILTVTGERPDSVTEISLDKTRVTLYLGENEDGSTWHTEETLKLTVQPATAYNKKVQWYNPNPSVVTMNSSLKMTPVSEGEATIVFTSEEGAHHALCHVTVEKDITASSVNIDKTEIELQEGENSVLTASLVPSTANHPNYIWDNSDPEVISIEKVNSGGITEQYKINALKAGQSIITVTQNTLNELKLQRRCIVTVAGEPSSPTDIPITNISFDNPPKNLSVGDKGQISVNYTPSNTTEKTLLWNTSEPEVITISGTGKYEALKAGTAKIIATAFNHENIKAECQITVEGDTVPVTGITLNKSSTTMDSGDTMTLTASVSPQTATDKTVIWTSSNNSIASVADGKVTAKGEGQAVITAETKDGGYTASCTVNVVVPVIHVSGIRLSETDLKLLIGTDAQGKLLYSEFTLVPTIIPENANTDRSIVWTSSNRDVAQVTDGVIYSTNYGKTTITATTVDGGHKATCELTVARPQPVTGITLNKTSETITIPASFKLAATVRPEEAVNKGVIWTSNNASVATVSDEGLVTATGEGVATITATTIEGGFKATCQVTVRSQTPAPAGKYTVVYDGNGATSGYMDYIDTFEAGRSVAVRKNEFKKTGYTFKNWNTSPNGKGTSYNPGGKYSEEENAVLYAQWSEIEQKDIPVESVRLNKLGLTLKPGNIKVLTATITPEYATDQRVTWSSNAPSIVSVTETGVITAIAEGSADITVKTIDGGKTATCHILVTTDGIDNRKLVFAQDEYQIYVRETKSVSVNIIPANEQTNQPIEYMSMDENVVKIDKTAGLITGVNPGVSYIYAMTEDKSKVAMCPVTVLNADIEVESVEFENHSLILKNGYSTLLKYTVNPQDAYDKSVTFTTTNSSVATVDNTGCVVSRTEGTADIVVKTNDGRYTDTCSIRVVPDDYEPIPVTGIRLTDDYFNMDIGEGLFVDATVVPSTATNKKINYESENKRIAYVSDDGYVYAISSGLVTITVTTEDGGYTATCRIKVRNKEADIVKIKSMTLNKKQLTLQPDYGEMLEVKITPLNATYSDCTWQSSNPRVADVYDGYVYAISDGTAAITAMALDGEHTATCKVTVEDPNLKHNKITYKLGPAPDTCNMINPAQYVPGSEFPLYGPYYEGLVFKGWYKDAKCTEAVSKVRKSDTGNLVFYAKWSKTPYHITYDYNGGEKVNNRTSYDVTTNTFSIKAPKRKNYKFLGWYDTEDELIKQIKKGTTGNISLVAKWSPVLHKVNYVLKGGELGDEPSTYTSDEEFVLPTPFRAGARFTGWLLDKQPVSVIPYGSSGTKKVTATWELNEYTIVYDPDGGEEVENKTEYNVETKTFKLKAPSHKGYKFEGWYDLDGNRRDKIEKGSYGDLYLTAAWTPIRYKIKYNTKGGRMLEFSPETYTIEDSIYLPECERNGYTFLGWQCGREMIDTIEEMTGNITVTAIWEKE